MVAVMARKITMGVLMLMLMLLITMTMTSTTTTQVAHAQRGGRLPSLIQVGDQEEDDDGEEEVQADDDGEEEEEEEGEEEEEEEEEGAEEGADDEEEDGEEAAEEDEGEEGVDADAKFAAVEVTEDEFEKMNDEILEGTALGNVFGGGRRMPRAGALSADERQQIEDNTKPISMKPAQCMLKREKGNKYTFKLRFSSKEEALACIQDRGEENACSTETSVLQNTWWKTFTKSVGTSKPVATAFAMVDCVSLDKKDPLLGACRGGEEFAVATLIIVLAGAPKTTTMDNGEIQYEQATQFTTAGSGASASFQTNVWYPDCDILLDPAVTA
eukprot:CAMPEP_0198713026 /NCGR_PEP_ID=MMETSP1471-20131121/4635_1 /TAXON_ID=41880 /ORGANISM="Pycnococcus provasolii, Strain RCC733" /LENGTH=327 /DNA_ID=CAMNT_0044473039 /DNA_START=42 /DNA_END=1025 /DNA_ORIENTATION=+